MKQQKHLLMRNKLGKYYEENPIGKKELQNIVIDIYNYESNLILFCEKI